MTLKTNNYVVLMKLETAPGTAISLLSGSSPAAGVSVIPVTEMAIPEIGGEELTSEVVQNGFQNTPGEGMTGKTMTFTLNCELAADGGGAISTGQTTPSDMELPYFDPLMTIAGVPATVELDYPTATNLVVRYAPDSDQALIGATATIGIWVDGRYFEAVGCRADVTVTREVGQKDMIAFAVSGAYSAVNDTTPALTATLPTYTPCVARSADFFFGGMNDDTEVAPICASAWEFSTQTEITQRKCLKAADGIGSYDITNRDPQVTTTVEAFPISTTDKQSAANGADWESGQYYDVYAALIAGTTSTMTLEFDAGSGNTKVWDFTATVQPTTVPHSDENGLFTHSGLGFRVVSTTKDGDFRLDGATTPYTA